MIAATRGEYKADPRKRGRSGGLAPLILFAVIVLIFMYLSSRASRMSAPFGRTYSRRGSSPWIVSSGGWGGGWGGGGGGGWGGGGGGGFSGGGGSFGGGGASGDW